MSDGDTMLKEIELGDAEKTKPPRRIIYFANGETMEEMSSEEEEEDEEEQKLDFRNVDTTQMSWRTYVQFWILRVATTAFFTCEFLGGKLANLFGLNVPKYQYAIDEYNRAQEEDSDDDDCGENVKDAGAADVQNEQHLLQMQSIEYGTIRVQDAPPAPGDQYQLDSETRPPDSIPSEK
ncbi:protein FAM177B [Pseudophryne corroboree]|uniref:protein FAM177B n=1 Tax=Pseudophryne corroboree TaxID=495146 RepID=UPI0030819EA4